MATNEQINQARDSYFDARRSHYDGLLSEKSKLAEKVESARRALLTLEPGHFSKYERAVFEETVRKNARTSKEADRRIAEYLPSEQAQKLDCM